VLSRKYEMKKQTIEEPKNNIKFNIICNNVILLPILYYVIIRYVLYSQISMSSFVIKLDLCLALNIVVG